MAQPAAGGWKAVMLVGGVPEIVAGSTREGASDPGHARHECMYTKFWGRSWANRKGHAWWVRAIFPQEILARTISHLEILQHT